MWDKLGFKENPYDTKPLKVSRADVQLLMGRESEQIDFLTAIELEIVIRITPLNTLYNLLLVLAYLRKSLQIFLDSNYLLNKLLETRNKPYRRTLGTNKIKNENNTF
jgi:hypothetical protein